MENFFRDDYPLENHVNNYKIKGLSVTIYNLGKKHTKISDETTSELKISRLDLGDLYIQLSESLLNNEDLIFL